MFGRQAAKCQDCHIVTHEKCRTNLSATCGLPTQFMQVYSQAMTQKSLSSAGGVLEADLKLIELGGWMKVKGLERLYCAVYVSYLVYSLVNVNGIRCCLGFK